MKNLILCIVLVLTVQIYASGSKRTITHKIGDSETLFHIALMYNSTVSDIMRANPGVDPKRIHAGHTILVPKDTKIRDADLVETLLKGGIWPPAAPTAVLAAPTTPQRPLKVDECQPGDIALMAPPITAPPAETAPAVSFGKVEDENPFITPVKQTATLERSYFEDLVELNTAAPITINEEKTAGVASPMMPENTITKSKDVQEIKLSGPGDNASEYESEELQTRYMELKRISSSDPSVQVIDLSKLKMDAGIYRDKLKLLNETIRTNQILVINLQIVLKDGSVKTITSPDEQKKILAQIISDGAAN